MTPARSVQPRLESVRPRGSMHTLSAARLNVVKNVPVSRRRRAAQSLKNPVFVDVLLFQIVSLCIFGGRDMLYQSLDRREGLPRERGLEDPGLSPPSVRKLFSIAPGQE